MSCKAQAHAHSSDADEELEANLAQLLHDGPLQDLVALKHMASSLASLAELGHLDRAARIAALEAHAAAAVENMRDLIRTFAEPAPPAIELYERLIEIARDFRESTGVDCRVHVKPQHLRFSPDVDDILYRAVRELFANVRQHARATRVKFSTSRRLDGSILITVADDGVGFTKPRRGHAFPQEGGFGLWSIEQRLASFCGYLELETDVGLRATLVVPGVCVRAEGTS